MRAKTIMLAADRRWILVSLVFLAVVLEGCAATMGTGIGSTPSGSNHATFIWYANGASTGQMTATLDNGQTFSGPYFQITRTTDVTTLGPLWAGWGRPFGAWGDWGPSSEFVTQYTGRVVGNLGSPSGAHMRCNFDLARPDLGMAGGGLGQCELPNGVTIDAMFAAA